MLFIRADWLHDAMTSQWGLAERVEGLEFLARRIDVSTATAAVGRIIALSADMSSHLAAELPIFLSEWARPISRCNFGTMPLELAPAEALLQADPSVSLRVGDLAQACGMTSTKFIREFKKHHGITPGDYLQDKRVNGARRLIGEGLPICQAALEMGFADQAHLQRVFKARHAMTPGLYRK